MIYYKFKNKIYQWLLYFVLFSFTGFFLVSLFFYNKKSTIKNNIVDLHKMHIQVLSVFDKSYQLLHIDINDYDFQFSDYRFQYHQIRRDISQLNSKLSNFQSKYTSKSIFSKNYCNSIAYSLNNYLSTLDTLVSLSLIEGVDEYGLVDENAKLAQQVNEILGNVNIKNPFHRIKITELSRFSIATVRRELHFFQNDISTSSSLSAEQKQNIQFLVNRYLKNAIRLIDLNYMLDVNGQNSYYAKLGNKKLQITTNLSEFEESLEEQYMIVKNYHLIFLISLITSFLIFSYFLGSFISKRVTLPLNWLSKNIMLAMGKKELTDLPKQKHFFKETFDLYNKFITLIRKLEDQENIRQKAQRDLLQSEKKYRELSDMLPQSVYETDKYGKLTYVNRAWLKTFGFKMEEIEKGLNIIETLISEDGEGIVSENKFIHSEFYAIRKDGTTFPALVYSNKIIKNNEICGVRGIVIDNSERKKYIELLKREKQKAEEADKLKSSFLANMSHEIRTPMNTIIGFSDLLASLDLSYNQKEEFLSHINNSGEVLLNLIDEIIDLAKIESGEIKLEKKLVSANTVCSDIFEMGKGLLNRSQKQNKVEIKLTIPEKDYLLFSDQIRVKQILTNLVNNAIKFTNEGFVHIGFHTKDQNRLLFFVKDTGIGFSSKNQDMIFERFKQVKNEKIKGTGLGLTISKNLVELLGGEIWAESSPGEGSSFYFSLEFADIRQQMPVLNKKMKTENDLDWKDKLILIAEDEDLNFKLIKEYISNTGAKVMRAYDGEEVVDICKNNKKVDIVIMDIQMPNVDGYVAIKEIRKFNKNIPIIVTTAVALSGQRQKCKMAGSNEFLTKPLKKEILLLTIDQYISRSIRNYCK